MRQGKNGGPAWQQLPERGIEHESNHTGTSALPCAPGISGADGAQADGGRACCRQRAAVGPQPLLHKLAQVVVRVQAAERVCIHLPCCCRRRHGEHTNAAAAGGRAGGGERRRRAAVAAAGNRGACSCRHCHRSWHQPYQTSARHARGGRFSVSGERRVPSAGRPPAQSQRTSMSKEFLLATRVAGRAPGASGVRGRSDAARWVRAQARCVAERIAGASEACVEPFGRTLGALSWRALPCRRKVAALHPFSTSAASQKHEQPISCSTFHSQLLPSVRRCRRPSAGCHFAAMYSRVRTQRQCCAAGLAATICRRRCRRRCLSPPSPHAWPHSHTGGELLDGTPGQAAAEPAAWRRPRIPHQSHSTHSRHPQRQRRRPAGRHPCSPATQCPALVRACHRPGGASGSAQAAGGHAAARQCTAEPGAGGGGCRAGAGGTCRRTRPPHPAAAGGQQRSGWHSCSSSITTHRSITGCSGSIAGRAGCCAATRQRVSAAAAPGAAACLLPGPRARAGVGACGSARAAAAGA